MHLVDIYTDGACSGNPGPGGWAALLKYGGKEKTLSGGSKATTNNIMELEAVIQALQALTKPCHVRIYTDSNYVLNGAKTWIINWQRKNWKNSKGEPVKNIDKWKELLPLLSKHKIDWHWVKGHSGVKENEYVDKIAKEALIRVNNL